MLAVHQIRQHAVEGRVELVEALDRAIVVRIAEPFAYEPLMVEDVVGNERFLVSNVLLLHGAFAVGVDESLMSDEVSGIVEDEASNAGGPFADGRKEFL